MHPVAALFGLACLGTCAAAPSRAAQFLAWSMITEWASANYLAVTGAPCFMAVTDLPVAIAAYAVWFEQRRTWQAWCAVLFGLRLPAHVLGAWGSVEWVSYLHTINALFLGSLIAIAFSGGVHAVLAGCGVRFIHGLRLRMASFAAMVRSQEAAG